MNVDAVMQTVVNSAVPVGVKLLGALALWIVGSWVVRGVMALVIRSMSARQVDATIQKYVGSILQSVLKVALVAAILGYLGLETTTFAAAVAAAGVAIGMAWSGLLANFAAGVFLILLRPFKVGDFVQVGGVTGTVTEVGMFVCKVDSPDNVCHIIGNNKIFSETILNYSTNAYRRVDLVAQLNHSVNYNDAITRLTARLKKIANVIPNVGPDVHILEFNLAGPVLCVRPYTHTDHYWDVYFATNAAIREEFGGAGYPVPEQHFYLRKAP